MSQMQIPVTDEDTDPLQSLEVELTPRQVDWLEREADERGLSVDHLLRSIITDRIRESNSKLAASSRSGDGVPHSPDVNPAPDADRDPADDGEEEGPSSIVDSLRSASERLQDLTEEDSDPESSSDLRDTLSRLQTYGDASSGEASPDEDPSVSEASSTEESADMVTDKQGRSMFDMIEDDE